MGLHLPAALATRALALGALPAPQELIDPRALKNVVEARQKIRLRFLTVPNTRHSSPARSNSTGRKRAGNSGWTCTAKPLLRQGRREARLTPMRWTMRLCACEKRFRGLPSTRLDGIQRGAWQASMRCGAAVLARRTAPPHPPSLGAFHPVRKLVCMFLLLLQDLFDQTACGVVLVADQANHLRVGLDGHPLSNQIGADHGQ